MQRIAIPMLDDNFSAHFGGADSFAIYEVGDDGAGVVNVERHTPPPHGRGVFPEWLRSLGVNAVLAGGMGWRASEMFESQGITVIMGIEGGRPEDLVKSYVRGELRSTGSSCSGGAHHGCDDHGEHAG
jgi:predicted Fe-Mo cluster-binding NifX family protein